VLLCIFIVHIDKKNYKTTTFAVGNTPSVDKLHNLFAYQNLSILIRYLRVLAGA
jgi:hypothetical protein